ncbi:hypothetical protein D3C72_851250 [compost metagenome]
MGIQGVTNRAEIVAVAQTANHIDDVKAHRRGADIHLPGFILPAHGHTCAVLFLAGVAAARRRRTGTPFRIVGAIFGIKRTGIHVHHIATEEHPPVRQRRVHLQHGGVGLQVGIATRSARTPKVMLQGDIQILLLVEIGRIAAHAAFQPVVFFVITRQAGKAVVICRTRRGDARGHHRIFVSIQRLLRLTALRLEVGRIAQDQRAFHRRRLRFRLRNNFVEGLLRSGSIAEIGLHSRHAALHVDRWRFAVLSGRQFRQFSAGRVFVAFRDIHFRKTQQRVFVLRFALQDGVVRRFRRGVIPTLLRPVRQR